MDREDLQGLLVHGYRRHAFARYHLLGFAAGQARAVLARLVTDVSAADEPHRAARFNLALSASGLRALGMSESEMAQFSREFRQGMAHPERTAALRDLDQDSPLSWEFAGPNHPALDALWMTYAETQEQLEELSARRERLFERFGVSWQTQDAQHLPHGARAPGKLPRRERVPLGEFVLGERDALGERQRGPFVALKFGARPLPDWSKSRNQLNFGQNGSYLVLRKLERLQPSVSPGAPSWVAEHAQRALGPEHSLQHRLLRRSRGYAEGLWFMAFNSDIRRQFEFVQQIYLNAAPGRPADETRHLFRVRGGAYLFLPGIRALNYLAEAGGT